MVFAFVMLNTLFVLVVFMLQLNQEQLHFKWPLGQDIQIFYDNEANLVRAIKGSHQYALKLIQHILRVPIMQRLRAFGTIFEMLQKLQA